MMIDRVDCTDNLPDANMYDLVILGGGCAGLSLATRLARSSNAPRTLILENRAGYEEDRTWCGWRLNPHIYEDCVTATWNRWRVASSGRTIERSSHRYPYEMIDAGRFYQVSSDAIASNPRISLKLGVEVLDTAADSSGITIQLADATLRAHRVVDTRPRIRQLTYPWLWQEFVGYVITFSGGVEDPLNLPLTLMDFQPASDAVAQFMYILPVTPRTYLCEWTRFSRESSAYAKIEAQLVAWLDANASGWRCLRRESGSLPMAPPVVTSSDPRLIYAGAAGGSMRASTGYAFHAIQRWADACAAALLQGGPLQAPPRSRVIQMLDGIFLRALQGNREQAPNLFLDLFEHTEPDALIRFLAGMPTLPDLGDVMFALPWRALLGAAATSHAKDPT